jgi:hypothetical protein
VSRQLVQPYISRFDNQYEHFVTLVLAALVHFVSVFSYEERQGGLFIAITSTLVFVPFGLLGLIKIGDKMKRRAAARQELEDSGKDEICEETEQTPARRRFPLCCCRRRQTAVQQKKKKPVMQRDKVHKELSNEGVMQIKVLSSVIDQHKHAALRTVELIYEQKIVMMQETDKARLLRAHVDVAKKARAVEKAKLKREEREAAHTAEVLGVQTMKKLALVRRLTERGLEVPEGKSDELRRVLVVALETDLAKASWTKEERDAAHTVEVQEVKTMKKPALVRRLTARGLEVKGKRDALQAQLLSALKADLLSAEENENRNVIDLTSEDAHAEHAGLVNEQRQLVRYRELEEALNEKLETVAAKFDALKPNLRDLKEQAGSDPRRYDLDFTNIIPVMDMYVVQLRELAEQKKHMMVSAEDATGQIQESQEEMRYKVAYLQLVLRDYDKDIDEEFINVFTTAHGPRTCHLSMLASAIRRSDIVRLCVKFGLVKQVQIRPTSAAFDGIGWAIVVFHHACAAAHISRAAAPILIANQPVCATAVGEAGSDAGGDSAATPAQSADPLEEMLAAESLLAVAGAAGGVGDQASVEQEQHLEKTLKEKALLEGEHKDALEKIDKLTEENRYHRSRLGFTPTDFKSDFNTIAKVQALQRSKIGRKKVAKEKQSIKKMQAIVRGRRDRQEAVKEKQHICTMQAVMRGRKARKEALDEKKCIANIQAVQRGRQARRAVFSKKLGYELTGGGKMQALTKIQAMQRSKSGRRLAVAEKQSIVKMQAALRGRKDRRLYNIAKAKKTILAECSCSDEEGMETPEKGKDKIWEEMSKKERVAATKLGKIEQAYV